ncbi:MAG: translation initiation factor IF-2 [Desulfovibrio sp.]|jgi:translation initiation factor IF-2|nr:translation initiation factor IF-2 [Desulfovibrio sp.]
MSEEKFKIKDIAVDLDVQPKEMLRALREIGLPVKSTVASIGREDVHRVRAYFETQKSQNVELSEVKSDIIVRRHRGRQNIKTDTFDATTDDAPPEPAQQKKTAHKAKKETAQVGEDVAEGQTPAGTSYVDEKLQGAKPEAKKTVKRGTRSSKIVAAPVRIISRPDEIVSNDEAPSDASGTTPAVEPVGVAEETLPKEDAKTASPVPPEASSKAEAKPLRLSRPDASAIPDTKSEPALSPRAKELDTRAQTDTTGKKRIDATLKPAHHSPKVKVISRPEPTREKQPSQQEGTAHPEARRGAKGARQTQQDNQRFTPPGQPSPTSEARDGQSKKKRLKGRRTVDFQQDSFSRSVDDEDAQRLNRGKGRRKSVKPVLQTQQPTQPIKAAKRKIRIGEAIRVADMAHQMGLKANEIIKILFGLGIMASINQSLDIDTATLVAAEFDYEVEKLGQTLKIPDPEPDKPESLKPRPPVVTIMGHVDHGKTSLLDAIRKTNVTSGEAGGITQHIGAYHVKTKRGEIVFLDTPGHEAFTAMRARGAQITDLVILVVAADDGVMEQTREAINHSRAANVPIMVAVNKMDKPGADPDRILRELAELGLQPEDWGGDTIVAKVSAKTRLGLDDLLEMVALQSEIMELRANPDKAARGRIVEARLDKGRGPVATVLIQQGTLKQGDNFVCGAFSGRVRALTNDQGKKVKSAGPSLPVEVQGFEGVPEAGEEFIVLEDEKLARRLADSMASKQREHDLASESRITLETFLSRSASEHEALTLNLVIKADVQGSLEAITEALNKESTDKVRIHVMHGGAGAISESDIMLASASNAIIIGFNVRPTAKVKETADRENVDIRFYNIIYKLVEDIKNAMAGLLAPVQKEVYLGQAEVRKTYNVPKAGTVAGSYVADGKISRNAGARLLRDGVVIYTGKVDSLKRFKDDAREVVKGNECGIGLENFNDIKEGDIIEAFETVEEAASL